MVDVFLIEEKKAGFIVFSSNVLVDWCYPKTLSFAIVSQAFIVTIWRADYWMLPDQIIL